MADFRPAFERTLLAEGGYKLTNVAADRGGMTYAGIARNRWSAWTGWTYIDRGQIPPTDLVREFYRSKFWDAIHGDDLKHQGIAESLFDFAVNAGEKTAIKLAQIVAGVAPDGAVGPKTIAALNALEVDYFRAHFALAKLARYRDIVTKDRSQAKFLLGWINRVLESA